jgi:type II secretory pathway component PulC
LKTGDEIIALNGLRIADPQKAMQAYAQLPYVDAWTARIHRDGVQTELRYALR